MGILKKFDDFKIKLICNKYNIKNYTINEDGSIDVDGNVNFNGRRITKLPLKFGHVSGHFLCSECNLKTLEGAPTYVGGNFSLYYCAGLRSLKYSTLYVGGDFDCTCCGLDNLEGVENTTVGGDFNFTMNDIYTFDKLPKSYDRLYMSQTPLISLGFGTFVNDSNFMDLWDAYDPIDKVGSEYIVYIDKLNLLREELRLRAIHKPSSKNDPLSEYYHTIGLKYTIK